jgi:hypothetical protein
MPRCIGGDPLTGAHGQYVRDGMPRNSRPLAAAPGGVEPKWDSDFAPETCHSQVLPDKIFERAGKDGLWPGV